MTLDSVKLRWGSIPEEDIRGFLLGYTIHYTEYQHQEASTENSKHPPQVQIQVMVKKKTAVENRMGKLACKLRII